MTESGMEERDDVRSMMPLLPLSMRSSNLCWPSSAAVEALEAVARGPEHSLVVSGEVMSRFISHLRDSLSLSSDESFAPSAPLGYSLFFDELFPREDSEDWFRNVVPWLANLLMRLPSLLEDHWRNADNFVPEKSGLVRTSLRVLDQQEAGVVLLSQELIAALLACSLFCLFPVRTRGAKHPPMINFDNMFASLYESYSEKQENKIKCIVHYFCRICSSMPMGFVSFERKVLPLEGPSLIPYPDSNFWSNSCNPLCLLEAHCSGRMEDHAGEAVLVDFANKFLGGGALNMGCVQEEILFMIKPELIAGLLFLPAMSDNEAIEITGIERFSSYIGYASSFRFSDDFIDKRDVDYIGRRKIKIVSIDALCRPGFRQYNSKFLLREINKAFCGFSNESEHPINDELFQESESLTSSVDNSGSCDFASCLEPSANPIQAEGEGRKEEGLQCQHQGPGCKNDECSIGIVTGNWGCGAFGGDPQLKAMIQWLAASQAHRPLVSYYTFGLEALQNLGQVSRWIIKHEWTVGDLWNLLGEYSSQRYKEETQLSFFSWLLPSDSCLMAGGLSPLSSNWALEFATGLTFSKLCNIKEPVQQSFYFDGRICFVTMKIQFAYSGRVNIGVVSLSARTSLGLLISMGIVLKYCYGVSNLLW